MARELAFAWEGGFIEVSANEGLEIRAANSTIHFYQREIVVEGLFYTHREYSSGRHRSQKKVVYVDFAFPLKGISDRKPRTLIMSQGDFSVGAFGVSYTPIDGVEYYLTIYPPPGTKYEYAVLTTRVLAILLHPRAQVYMMDEGKVKRLIFV